MLNRLLIKRFFTLAFDRVSLSLFTKIKLRLKPLSMSSMHISMAECKNEEHVSATAATIEESKRVIEDGRRR
jgi:hypothetical protein